MNEANIQATLSKISPILKKSLLKHFFSFENKTKDFLQIFPDFFQLWKIAGQIFKTFSSIQDSTNPE